MQTEVYCLREDSKEIALAEPIAYPYKQPWKEGEEFIDQRDPMNRNVKKSWFYYPKKIKTIDDYFEKLGIQIVWGLIPPFNWMFNFAIISNNALNYG